MYSLVSLLSGIYPFLAMHSLLVTIICYEIFNRLHCMKISYENKKFEHEISQWRLLQLTAYTYLPWVVFKL